MKFTEVEASHRILLGRRIRHYDAVESTNDVAKEVLEAGVPEGLVIWADRQVAGRGRHDRAWASPLGGLYFSMILRPKGSHAHILGLLMGIPLIKAFRHFGVLAGLKWPNDAVYQNRKIAGILSEGVYHRDQFHVIVGVGVNTNVDLDQLPPGVQERATSLKREVSLFVSNEEFLDFYLGRAEEAYSRYHSTPIPILMKDYRGMCLTVGQQLSVTAEKATFTGWGM